MSTILLVDDDFAILEGLAFLLEGEGYRVRKASDGEDALARLAEEPLVDLVISDVMMPAMPGTALLEAMRADARLRPIPVVLMTASRVFKRPDNPQCVAVLAKPFLLDTLLDVVRTVLDGRASGR